MGGQPELAEAQQSDTGFFVELERFQGPLDLLLYLIRSQDIDIFDIPIARITGQFLKAVEEAETLGLDKAGEFLEVAAMLVRIKLELLLPRQRDEYGETEDPRTELVQRLLEYEHFMEAARQLGGLEAERARCYPLGYIPVLERRDGEASLSQLDIQLDDVVAAAHRLSQRRPAPGGFRVVRHVVSLEDKVSLILGSLGRWARIEFRKLVAPFNSRAHTVATLLAGLELARERKLAMRQRKLFSPLWFYRKKMKKGDNADSASR